LILVTAAPDDEHSTVWNLAVYLLKVKVTFNITWQQWPWCWLKFLCSSGGIERLKQCSVVMKIPLGLPVSKILPCASPKTYL